MEFVQSRFGANCTQFLARGFPAASFAAALSHLQRSCRNNKPQQEAPTTSGEQIVVQTVSAKRLL